MIVHEFEEPIEVDTPLGRGRALFVMCTAHDNQWTVAINSTPPAFVTFTQDRIRPTNSYTFRRGIDDERMRQIINPASSAARARR